MSNLNLKSLSEDDRPREKMISKGKESLSNAELIAILLGSGNSKKNAVELAKELLLRNENSLNNLSCNSINELTTFEGVGPAKAVSIMAGLELSRRKLLEESKQIKKVSSSNDAYQILSPWFLDKDVEEFRLILLSRSNTVLSTELISSGGKSGTVVDGKIIFKKALMFEASAIILAHNHPSGNVSPSIQDKQITRKLIEFGKLIDCPVLDHLIIGRKNYFSFADEGILERG